MVARGGSDADPGSSRGLRPQLIRPKPVGRLGRAASWLDNLRAYQLGYRRAGKAEDHRAHAEAEQVKIGSDPVGDLGGTFTSAEFANDVKRAGP